MRKSKKIGVVACCMCLLMGAILPVEAGCSGWTYRVTRRPCVYPNCGPGYILYTQMESGVQERYCDHNGKQELESRPFSRNTGRCCNTYNP